MKDLQNDLYHPRLYNKNTPTLEVQVNESCDVVDVVHLALTLSMLKFYDLVNLVLSVEIMMLLRLTFLVLQSDLLMTWFEVT